MLVLIDNYDSFTYNLVHFLGELGAPCEVFRNDKISVAGVLKLKPKGIVLSPGPCTPNEAGICCELIAKAGPKVPVLGVCLGHQAIGQVYGGVVMRAPVLMHGKLSKITNTGKGLFKSLPKSFEVTRYHSLIVERKTLAEWYFPGKDERRGLPLGEVAFTADTLHDVRSVSKSVVSILGYQTPRRRWLPMFGRTWLTSI